jgi:hypothetical protein
MVEERPKLARLWAPTQARCAKKNVDDCLMHIGQDAQRFT